MRVSIVSFASVLIASLVAPSALAAERCEHQAAVSALAKLPGSAALRVTKDAGKTSLIDVVTKKVVVEATCDGVKVPLADELVPAKGKQQSTYKDERYTVALSGKGAISLSIAPGVAALDGIELVAFDDDAVTLTDDRGRVWYSLTTRPDGTLVEVEGGHNGCGCERTTLPSGQQVTRKL